MATVVKRKLSGSTAGVGILVAGTASTAADTIHEAVAGVTPGTFDEIWLWAHNTGTTGRTLTVELGTNGTMGIVKQLIPYQAGLFLIVPGLILQNGVTVKAHCSEANVVAIQGYVNSMTD